MTAKVGEIEIVVDETMPKNEVRMVSVKPLLMVWHDGKLHLEYECDTVRLINVGEANDG